jgi:regulator of protease activity HflC (stomatin/prohibitin superfamily)
MKMLGYKRVTIAQNERGVLLRHGRFEDVLGPGAHNLFGGEVEVLICNVAVPEFDHARVDILLKDGRERMSRHFVIYEVGENEAGVVFKNGRPSGVLAPGKRALYWRGPVEVRVERFDISRELEQWRVRVARKACEVRRHEHPPRLIADSRMGLRALEHAPKKSG